jgi:hypothetical protein
MSRLRRLLPSRAMAVALLAVFLAVGGRSAYAAANSFLLNTTNTSSAQTTLNGSAVTGPALQLTNTSKNKNATALALDVNTANAPFTVNSTKKVAKLNADRLDGIDSKGFVQGSEHALANRVSLTVPVDQNTAATVLTLPGFGTLTVNCSDLSNGANENYVSFTNTSGSALDVDRLEMYSDQDNTPTKLTEDVLSPGATDSTDFSFVVDAGDIALSRAEYQIGTGTGSGSQLATIVANVTMPRGSATCVTSAQAITMP